MDDLTKKLAAEYDLAMLYRDCEDFSRPTDREKYRKIRRRYAKMVKDQTKAYERDYSKRLTMAGRRIAEEKGLNFDKLIKAKDPLSKRQTKLLKRLAHRDIQSDHLRRVAVIRNRMAQELSDLRDTVRMREAGQETPQQSPKLLTDGRADAERMTLRPKH
jgi:hypothetical protein